MFRSALTLLVATLALIAWGQQKRTICIDPGHPSENGVGTSGKSISEVAAAWKVAVVLKQLLQQAGYQVVMTKTTQNQRVTNKARAEIANSAHASLMLRLHCDAASDSGFASYYPATTGTSNGVTGPSKDVIATSRAAAQRFHPAVVAALKGYLRDRGAKTDRQTAIGGKQGALTGSIFSKVPVILVEMCVLQNKHDDAFMGSAKGQQKMAEALLAGVEAAVPLNR